MMKLELKLKSIFNVTLKKAGQDRTGSGCRILAGQVIGHEKVSTCSALVIHVSMIDTNGSK